MNKNIGKGLIIIGALTLAASILCGFWIGGRIVFILMALSVIINTTGIMVLTSNKKR